MPLGRLTIALGLQAAVAAVDIAVGSRLVITSAALLVPLALAIIGTERETAITGAVAIALGLAGFAWNDVPSTGQAIYRVFFFCAFALLAVLAARARERATGLASDLDATQARLDGILGSLGEAVTVHDERGKTIYANQAAARLLGSESVAAVLAAEP